MKQTLTIFGVTALIFLVVDALWLKFVAWPLYQNKVGHLMKSVDILPAVIFYVIYVFGMIYFVVSPNLDNFELRKVISTGFFFGIVCYATYDLTNMATMNDWDWTITLIDIIWGGTVTMLTTGIVTYLFSGR